MTIATGTISGQIVLPDLTGGAMVLTLEATSDASIVTYAGMAIGGKIRVPIAADGTASVTLPKIPQAGLLPSSGVLWHANVKVNGESLDFYFSLTADTTWDAVLTAANTTAPPSLLGDVIIARDAAIAAASAVRAGTWQATTAYAAGQTIQAPDGSLIKTATSRTSRATFDATEQTFWTPVATTVGTLEQVAQQASNDARFTRITEPPLSPYRYGFVGNGSADDTTALQNTINAVPSGGAMEFPHSGNAKITAPLTISTSGITIQGRGSYTQRLLAVGCDGIRISAGVTDVHLNSFELAQATRYSTTPNAFIGIKADGVSGSQVKGQFYRDIYVDGFQTGFYVRHTWESRFESCRTAFGLQGIMAYGQSVNNWVEGCHLDVVNGVTNSRGIGLIGQESSTNTSEVASEGWVITSNETTHGEVGIDMLSYNHVLIHHNIIDFNNIYGIRMQSGTVSFANNITATGNYVAMNATGSAAIMVNNAINNSALRYGRIMGNDLLVYTGSTCTKGIDLAGTFTRAIVTDNSLLGFGTYDIHLQSANNICHDNACLSNITPNIHPGVGNNLIHDNYTPIGGVFRPGNVPGLSPYQMSPQGFKVVEATAAPLTGAWNRGDRVVNAVPTVASPKSWVCTVAGSPGTWVSEGNL